MGKIKKQGQTVPQTKLGTGLFMGLALFAGLIGVGGCNKASTNGNTTAPQNTAEKTNTAAPKNEEPAKILKPGDVGPGQTLKVIELVDSVAADKDAWKGKEVTVTGYVSATSGSGKQALLTIINDLSSTNKKDISCAFLGDKDAVFGKTIEVTGKIRYSDTGGEYKSVNLEPCDLKK